MKIVLFVTLCLVAADAFNKELNGAQWMLYKKAFSKIYEPEEDLRRFNIFVENWFKIIEHNKRHKNGEVTYKVGINQFTDMLQSEATSTMKDFNNSFPKLTTPLVDNGKKAPASIDWRNKGVVTPVKNQGQCGNPFVFSAVESLESQEAIKTGKLVPLSVQNLIDCFAVDGKSSCVGYLADFDSLFNDIKLNGGIDTEASYPETDVPEKCHFNNATVGATVTGYVNLPQGNEEALKNAVGNIGPVAVLIDASNWSFQMYSGGIYNEPNCSSEQLDHAAVIVGYGIENGIDYWLVRNSWGPQWGEDGYIKMSRNANNQCGIATRACYPTV